ATVTVADSCAAVANVGGITGTIYNDASTITVTGCNTSATEIRIYDTTAGVLKGQNSSPGGSSTVVVSVSGLVQGNTVKAVQVVGAQESCQNTAPSKVVQGPVCTSVASITGPFLGPIDMLTQSVGIKGVSTSATNVHIYQNDILVGRRTVSAATNVTVACAGLVKGGVIKATQVINGMESCLSSAPTFTSVGSGAPNVRFTIGLRNTTTAASPLGFNGGQTGTLYCIGANGGGTIAQHTPATGIPDKNIIISGSGWQTLTFSNGVDPCFNYTANTVVASVPGNTDANGTWAVLEGLYIIPDDPNDTGAYAIYIDNIKNGNSVFEDFETRAIGMSGAAFGVPHFSSTTGPNLLGGTSFAAPDATVVTNRYADTGTKSELVKFQFTDTHVGNWVRLTTAGSSTSANPSFDVSKPISMRVMVVRLFTATVAGNQLILDWYGTSNLESKDSLNQPVWDSVGVNTGPYTNTISGPAKFYRLHNP
ncbi:MAG: hypothetical protein JWM68_446, partial [Verrucomicrobiales bacterium]|nr:hypothetical protein [Verrucomicrobiales bacterium]